MTPSEAATIAPAAHDFLWITEDELISWVLSMITGAVFGILITLLILADNDGGPVTGEALANAQG